MKMKDAFRQAFELESSLLNFKLGAKLSWLERLHGMQEVIGSTPIFSTLRQV